MRHPGWVDQFARTGSWICRRCVRGRRKTVAHLAAYTTNLGTSPPRAIFAQRASHLRRGWYESTMLKHITLEKCRSRSFTFYGPISNELKLNKYPVSKGTKRVAILALLGLIWAFSDDAKHRYLAVKRASRVFYALIRCLREYVLPAVVHQVEGSSLHS